MKAKELKKLINQLDDDANVHFYILPIDKNLAEDNDANDIWLGEPQVISSDGQFGGEGAYEYMDFGFEERLSEEDGRTIFKECKTQLEEFEYAISDIPMLIVRRKPMRDNQFPEGFEWLDARDDRCEKWLKWKEENCECGISEITGKWSEELAERVGCICEELNFDLYLELVGDAAFPRKLEGVSDD